MKQKVRGGGVKRLAEAVLKARYGRSVPFLIFMLLHHRLFKHSAQAFVYLYTAKCCCSQSELCLNVIEKVLKLPRVAPCPVFSQDGLTGEVQMGQHLYEHSTWVGTEGSFRIP